MVKRLKFEPLFLGMITSMALLATVFTFSFLSSPLSPDLSITFPNRGETSRAHFGITQLNMVFEHSGWVSQTGLSFVYVYPNRDKQKTKNL